MGEKIVLVTAGGHIPPFHAAMMRMWEALDEKAPGRFELLGAWGGLGGLMAGNLVSIRPEDVESDRAGSLIGADRRLADPDRIAQVAKEQGIYAIVIMGGDNHMGELAKVDGVRVVGWPKTMDGDLNSFITLGWHTAVTIGSMQTRWHHHAGMTGRRVFFVGLFGRNTDWNVYAVTAYGGGDLGIPGEVEYDAEAVFERITRAVRANRERYGIDFAVVPYSEGVRVRGLNEPPPEHCSRDSFGQPKLQPEWIGMELVRLARLCGLSAAFQAHTYDMRDSPPTEVDKRLSKMAGEECINMILDGDFGRAVVFEPDGQNFFRTARKPIHEVAIQRKLKSTKYFDYERLLPTPAFFCTYADLFRDPLGDPPVKDDLVYRNLRQR